MLCANVTLRVTGKRETLTDLRHPVAVAAISRAKDPLIREMIFEIENINKQIMRNRDMVCREGRGEVCWWAYFRKAPS